MRLVIMIVSNELMKKIIYINELTNDYAFKWFVCSNNKSTWADADMASVFKLIIKKLEYYEVRATLIHFKYGCALSKSVF